MAPFQTNHRRLYLALTNALAAACLAGVVAACGGGGGGADRSGSGGSDVSTLWHQPVQIGALSDENLRPHVALDPAGNALAVWEWVKKDQWGDDSEFAIRSSYGGGAGWQKEETVVAEPWTLARQQLVLDNNGSGWLVSARINDTQVQSSRFLAGDGWNVVIAIPQVNAGGLVKNPQVGVDASGNAFAVWQEPGLGGGNFRVWASRFDQSGMSWSAPERLDSSGETALNPQVAVHSDGRAVVVWWQDDGDGNASLWSKRYELNNGWGQTRKIRDVAQAAFTGLSLGMDAQGNAVAVAQQLDLSGLSSSLWAISYDSPTDTWGAGKRLDNGAGLLIFSVIEPKMAVDAVGNAVVAWQQAEDYQSSIWAARLSADTGDWGAPVQISLDDVDGSGDSDAESVSIAMDDNGTAWIVWQQNKSRNDYIWASRYVVGGNGWSQAARIETSSVGDASNPQIAMNATGEAVAVWVQHHNADNQDSIWASRLKQ